MMSYALVLSLLAVLAVYDVRATDCLPCAAETNSPITGMVTGGSGATAGQVCCVSGGQNYFCQTQEVAAASGGLLSQLKLTGILCPLLNGLDLALSTNLAVILKCATGQTVTCTPPPVPPTPTPGSDYCTKQCTSGVCCTTNGCPA